MILHPFLQAFISMKWQNSTRFHYLRLLVHVVFIIFITFLANDYRQNSICVEILQDKNDLSTIQHDATINCNQFVQSPEWNETNQYLKNITDDLVEDIEERICHYKNNSKCYYAGHYRNLLKKFHRNNDEMVKQKAIIVDDGSINKYGLILCHNPNAIKKSKTILPQILDPKSKEAKMINLQCKKGYLLDDMDRYDVYGPLCGIIGYDEHTCPTDRIMSWSACQIFGYVCKFCLVCSHENKASFSIYMFH